MTLRLLLPPSVGAARARARAELLDLSLRADLAEPVEVDVANDYSDLASRAEGDDAHLVWLPPTLCARLERRLRGLYKCLRQGRGTYRSALIARRGELVTPADARGRRVAWVDRLSVGGHLLAASELRRAGVDPINDLAGQSFVGSYPEVVRALLDGTADLGAIMVRDDSADAVRESLAAYGGKSATDRLSSLRVTASSPNDAIGITRALGARRAERLATRVLEREGARARAALCLALDAEGFVRATADEYAALRSLLPPT